LDWWTEVSAVWVEEARGGGAARFKEQAAPSQLASSDLSCREREAGKQASKPASHWDKFQSKIELACCVGRRSGAVANPTRVSEHHAHPQSNNRTSTV